MTHEVDFLIVGAGAAGIGAARRLAALGAAPLVLEASDRIGGRAQTTHVRGQALDLGCGWLHSSDRNPWVPIAESSGFEIDRREAVWGDQFHDLGFSRDEQTAASNGYDVWSARLPKVVQGSDRASDALMPNGEWNAFIGAMTGFISGVGPDCISAKDYLAYDEASTKNNWRVVGGYGSLVVASLPGSVAVRTGTAVERLGLTGDGVEVATPAGTLRARAVILTVSTAVLAGDAIRLPADLDSWRSAAAALPLGRNEKVFLEIVGAPRSKTRPTSSATRIGRRRVDTTSAPLARR